MTDAENNLAQLFAACWKDDALKQRMMSDPKSVLAEHGIEIPDGMNVKVVENNDNTVHITMPATPENVQQVSDEELTAIAGGSYPANCTGMPTCTKCGLTCKKE